MRNQGIEYGYSRGSVSGSLIAYLLHITDVDSIQHKLNFERKHIAFVKTGELLESPKSQLNYNVIGNDKRECLKISWIG